MAVRSLPVWLLLAALQAGANPAPQPQRSRQAGLLSTLNSREALQDSLERFFDQQICGPLKDGLRRLPPEVAEPGAHPSADAFALLSSCSLRALRFDPVPDGTGASAHLLWELEGYSPTGQRQRETREADAALQRVGERWRLVGLTPTTDTRVTRPPRRFTEVAAEAGLVVPRGPPLSPGERSRKAMTTGGIAVRDFDGDGLQDVVVVETRHAWLFHNEGGMRFRREPIDVSPPPGTWLSSAIAGDFDDDGDADLLITVHTDHPGSRPPSFILRNDGGHLTVVGRLPTGGETQAGLAADLDGDGHLDVVELSYPSWSWPDNFLEATDGSPPRFYRGDGHLGFTPLKLPPGLVKTHGRWGLAAVAADLTGAGRTQVYVANDYGSKDLWTLLPDGTFTETAAQHGLDDPGNGMSADVGDLDGDGRLDLYLANMFSKAGTRVLRAADLPPGPQQQRLDKFAAGNTLYLARPDGTFVERARELGVNRGLWAFGSIFVDYDNDGRLDLAVANGYVSNPDRKDL